jgi:hypothetical protein
MIEAGTGVNDVNYSSDVSFELTLLKVVLMIFWIFAKALILVS